MAITFVTADPRVSGRAAEVGSTVYYVADGSATALYKYGPINTQWSLTDAGGGEPVTADPRVGGLDRPIGTRAIMFGGVPTGLDLLKYGPQNTDWCTWSAPPSMATQAAIDGRAATVHGHAESDVTGLVSDLAAKVAATRAINTTAPLTGGGDMSGDRTLAVNTFGSAQAGVVPASGGGTANYLRADGAWTAPSGGPGGGVSGVAIVDFGAFPGAIDASVAVTGQTSITADSVISVRARLADTADHSADEHRVEDLAFAGGAIDPAASFTIFARSTDKQRRYGQWAVGWSY